MEAGQRAVVEEDADLPVAVGSLGLLNKLPERLRLGLFSLPVLILLIIGVAVRLQTGRIVDLVRL